MKPEDLLAELEQDQEWRVNELNVLFRDTSDVDTSEMRVRRRSTVPMIQAHAEGFVRFALRAYIRYVNSQGVRGTDLRYEHVAWCLKPQFSNLRAGSSDAGFDKLGFGKNPRAKTHYTETRFVEELRRIMDAPMSLDESPLDRFEQNLDERFLLALMFQCGLDYGPHREYARSLNGLVKRRNEVAHGEESVASLNELTRWRDVVFQLFTFVRDTVYDAAAGQTYRRNPAARVASG